MCEVFPHGLFALMRQLHGQIDEYGMVSYIPMDINSEKSVARVLSHIDNAIQFGEDEEPKEHDVRRRVPSDESRGRLAY